MLTKHQNIEEQISADFKTLEHNLNGERSSEIHQLRQKAYERFQQLGFPTTKNEEWKYTRLKKVLEQDFHQQIIHPVTAPDKNVINELQIGNLKANILVFINGFYNNELSTIIEENNRIILGSLSKQKDNELFRKHFGQYADIENDAFAALSTAFVQDGAFISIPDNTETKYPVHILYITDKSKEATFSQPRNLIIAGKNARVKVIESHHSLSEDDNTFTNTVTEIKAEKESFIELYKPQVESLPDYHIDFTYVSQEEKSNVLTHTVTLNGKMVRNDLNYIVSGNHAESHLFGLYILNNEQHTDNHTLVDHAEPDCFSNELYKGILDGSSTGVFNGKVLVRQNAQRTNAFQSNKNIMLSERATINTKPQLEIFADDVKCSHGATSGQLDKDSVFYLRSRGMSEEKAETLLTHAYAGEVINKVTIEPLKEYLAEKVHEKLS